MKYLPLFTDIKDKAVLIVGGGAIALRKARLVVDAGANVTIVSLQFIDELTSMDDNGEIKLITGKFCADYLDKQILVIAATEDTQVNQNVSQAANDRHILVNVVDDPQKSSFIFPAIVDRSPIMVAVSSGGAAPVLVRRLREKLETLLPQHLGALADLVGRFRGKAKQVLGTINLRRQFWEHILSGPVVSLLSQKKQQQAENLLSEQLASFSNTSANGNTKSNPLTRGEVYIVGGGPGDPDLLTIKALQLMQQADVVVHDGLVSDAVLNLVRRDADRISVSKSARCHSMPQDEINQLLVDLANKGHKVCRLKGGDPFIYGRGGEEVEGLAAAGIPYQIVPGITAAAGCAAYAGIPLTHRDHAQAVQFVTGHTQKNGQGPDWQSLAKPRQTVVIYMGLINSADIVDKLVSNGRDPATPVAIVQSGTTDKQRVFTGQLSELVTLIAAQKVASPALIIVGEVVALQSKLQWFSAQANTSSYDQPLVQLEETPAQPLSSAT
jgi:uroporphyrin-III C-methyltransferase/precorrin-2 dehydrogenase/sirohydrochlorin ferrochelatase